MSCVIHIHPHVHTHTPTFARTLTRTHALPNALTTRCEMAIFLTQIPIVFVKKVVLEIRKLDFKVTLNDYDSIGVDQGVGNIATEETATCNAKI